SRARRSTYWALTSLPVMCSLCTLPTFASSSMVASKCAAGTMKLMTPVRIWLAWLAVSGLAWASVPAMKPPCDSTRVRTCASFETASQASQIRTGVVNFMVPAAHFDATIDELAKVGKVQSEHITGSDVSAQYVDLRARLANAEAQHNAMLALLTKAQNINDIIAVQNQIGQITSQIEQLKGQIKYLDDNTSYSSISVTMAESGAPAPTAKADSWGFATALSDAAHNFVTTINY